MDDVVNRRAADGDAGQDERSETEQDALAAAIRAEIRAEREWQRLLDGSQAELKQMADAALAEHAAGRSRPLVPDDL